MAQITRSELERLGAAIRDQEWLARLAGEIERLHRVVFHGNTRADWSRVRASAEQILIAEIVNRHRGDIGGLHAVVEAQARRARGWDAALAQTAAGMHSYYTTPLGVVMRQDLFGPDAIFFTADAYEWTEQLRPTGRPAAPPEPTSPRNTDTP